MRIILVKPRGFCAGVERAILCAERSLERFGAPVYALNDIVHNATVVRGLTDKGIVFVKDLDKVPEASHVLFSAHGVGPDKWIKAEKRRLKVIDATCPLVEKVHKEAVRFAEKGYTIILIGEAGHDEVVGTRGWAPDNIIVLFSEEEVMALSVPDETKMAYVTQTTLDVEDREKVVEVLKRRFPNIEEPAADDICYATQNRQGAVNALVSEANLVLVLGDLESANSRRLAEICRKQGKTAYLISSAGAIDADWLDGVDTVLVTSGASVPEFLVQETIGWLKAQTDCVLEEREITCEDVHFKLPGAVA